MTLKLHNQSFSVGRNFTNGQCPSVTWPSFSLIAYNSSTTPKIANIVISSEPAARPGQRKRTHRKNVNYMPLQPVAMEWPRRTVALKPNYTCTCCVGLNTWLFDVFFFNMPWIEEGLTLCRQVLRKILLLFSCYVRWALHSAQLYSTVDNPR